MDTLLQQSIEQWHTSQLDTAHELASCTLQGLQSLAELNLQAMRATVQENGEQIGALLTSGDFASATDLAMAQLEPASRKAQAYSGHVQRIVEKAGTDIASVMSKRFEVSCKQLFAVADVKTREAQSAS
ncbi:MAG: phasin family protein [Burkholderiaceae bacterium]